MSLAFSCDRPSIHEGVTFEVFDSDEFAVNIFDQRTCSIHRLNQSAAAVWLLCDGSTSISEMERELVDLFGITVSQARDSVGRAVQSFWESGALVGSPPPEAVSPTVRDLEVLVRPPDP